MDKNLRKLYSQSFSLKNSTPFAWGMAAKPLWVAANELGNIILDSRDRLEEIPSPEGIIYEDSEYGQIVSKIEMWKPCLMMVAYTFECIMKGAISGSHLNAENFGEKTKFEALNFGHRLPDMVKELKIELNETESFIIDYLAQFATWKGRYLAPKVADDYFKDLDRTKKNNPHNWIERNEGSPFSDDINNLFQKLVKCLNAAFEVERNIRTKPPSTS